jgi:hypothetical protein
MRIRIGYEITYDCPQATPFVLTLRVSAAWPLFVERLLCN